MKPRNGNTVRSAAGSSAIAASLVAVMCAAGSCVSPQKAAEQARQDFTTKTGLKETAVTEGGLQYYGKTHRGYQVLFTAKAGNVWGRLAARVAIGEAGRELGPVGQFLSGSYEHIGTVVGGPLDRLLSKAIGQPISFFIILKHAKPSAPRLDIISGYSTIKPSDPQPSKHRLGFRAGEICSADDALVGRILANKKLTETLAGFRSQYIRLDTDAVTFMFAGSENEWSSTIREHGTYDKLINTIMDTLADVADLLK